MEPVIHTQKLQFLNVPFELHLSTCPVKMAKYELCKYSWEENATRK